MEKVGKLIINNMKKQILTALALVCLWVPAAFASPPTDIVVSNLTNTAAFISLQTGSSSQVTINAGTSTASMTIFASDRLNNGFTHYFGMTGLTAGTTYYYQIISNGVTDNNSGAYYSFTTFPSVGVGSPGKTYFGTVFQISGAPNTANISIVHFQLFNGSAYSVTMSSTLNASDNYLFLSANLKNAADGSAYAFSAGQTVYVTVLGGNFGELRTTFTTAAAPAVEQRNFTLLADTTGPTFTQRNPNTSSTNIPVNSDVFFHVTDNDLAVSLNSLNVQLGVTMAVVAGVQQAGYVLTTSSDGSGGYLVTINPTVDFAFGASIQVSVNARDVSNNIGTANYSFTTTSGDTTGPVITALIPTASATNVAINTDVSMNINDVASGVSLNTIRVTINGTLAVNNGAAVGSPFPATIVASGLGYNININPDVDFANSAVITLQISARDISGNITNGSYSFTTIAAGPIDSTPPTTSSHSPARAATGVSSNGSIVVHVTDAGVGVSQSSIVMTVSGNTVSPVITGTAADYTLTYAFTGYSAGQTINVTVAARDVSNNIMTTDNYYFVIYSAPVTSNWIAPYPISVPTIFDPSIGQTTQLMWPLATTEEVIMKIYDINGQSILQRRFLAGSMGATAGINNVYVWDGRDDLNRLQSTGIYYFYLISTQAGQQKVLGRGNIIIKRTR